MANEIEEIKTNNNLDPFVMEGFAAATAAQDAGLPPEQWVAAAEKARKSCEDRKTKSVSVD